MSATSRKGVDRRPLAHRSYLFAPGSNEQLMRKALSAGADAVVFDLEDSVPPADKVGARSVVSALLAESAATAACGVHVRVNRVGVDYSTDDVRAALVPGVQGLRLPKAETPAAILAVDELVSELERQRGIDPDSIRLYPTVESALGLVNAGELAGASERVEALVFGEADFAADLGLSAVSSFLPMLTARSTLVAVSRACGVDRPVDGAFTQLDDLTGLAEHARGVKELGFGGKSAIHPKQLPIIHGAFQPTDAELQNAQAILAAAAAGDGVTVVDGRFVDPAIIAHAVRVVESAARGTKPYQHKGELL